jgi:caa(3)-type oxidase subunit IV
MRSFYFAYLALIALLGLTYGASFVPLGPMLGTLAGLLIGLMKTLIIIRIFMEFGNAGRTARTFLFVGLGWLSILSFVLFDYATRSLDVLPRGWNPRQTTTMIGSNIEGGEPTPLRSK